MAMKYDVISALFKGRTDGQSGTQAGGTAGDTTVRHGTAQADSAGGFVEVLLDGSEDSVTVACEADVKSGQRVSVVNRGGIYKVVSLGDLPERVDGISSSVDQFGTKLDEEVQARKDAVEDARKVATNYISTTSTGAIMIADMNTPEATRSNAVFDAYGMKVRKGETEYAVFGEVSTIGPEDDYHTTISGEGMQLHHGGYLTGTMATYVIDGVDAGMAISSSGGVQVMGGDTNYKTSVDVGDYTASLGSVHAQFFTSTDTSGSTPKSLATMRAENDVSVASDTGTATVMGGSNQLKVSPTRIEAQNRAGAPDAPTRVYISDRICSMGCSNGYVNAGYLTADGGGIDATRTYVSAGADIMNFGKATTTTSITVKAQWKTGCYIRKWGPIVIADINYTVPSSGWAAGTSHSFGTLGTGYRPSGGSRANCALANPSGSGMEAFAYVTSNGNIAIYVPQQTPAGNDFCGQLVWFANS